jgi:hypothetical protein
MLLIYNRTAVRLGENTKNSIISGNIFHSPGKRIFITKDADGNNIVDNKFINFIKGKKDANIIDNGSNTIKRLIN